MIQQPKSRQHTYFYKRREYGNLENYLFKVRNEATSYCLDANGNKNGKAVIGYNCHGQGGNQVSLIIPSNPILSLSKYFFSIG